MDRDQPVVDEALLGRAMANPGAALDELDRLRAEESLLEFIKLTWHVLEPSRDFVDGWAVQAICEHLEAVTHGEIHKLLINVPPGCMKSLTTNVFWPAWEWGPRNMPSNRYIGASYSETLTIRDNRRTRALIRSPIYQKLWGDRFQILSEQDAKQRFDTTATGWKIATSVGGLGTGERADRFIIDDPHNVKEAESDAIMNGSLQWYTEVVPTRMNEMTGPRKSAQVVIMQRVKENDISGLIIEEKLGHVHLCLPMEFEEERKCFTSIGFEDPRTVDGELLWPERFPKDYLDEDLKPALRSWGGTYAEAGQLQQRPTPRGGGMFKRKDFQFVDIAPPSAKRVRGWDLAATMDAGAWTVGLRMSRDAEGRYYIEHIKRLQGSELEVNKALTSCAEADTRKTRISVPQDPGQAGKVQKRALAALLAGYHVKFSLESGAKEDRAKPLAAQAEAGNLFLVRGSWNEEFIKEACLFPYGKWSDQVDAGSRAFGELITKGRTRLAAGPRLVVH